MLKEAKTGIDVSSDAGGNSSATVNPGASKSWKAKENGGAKPVTSDQ